MEEIDGLKEKILAFMQEQADRPLSTKELARNLGIKRDALSRFKKLLGRMEADASVIVTRTGHYALASKLNLVAGELICHPDGFGFVRPESGEGEDVFINPRKLSGAMHGDKIVARVDGYKSGGRREGSIVRIVKRAHKTVVGRFERASGFSVVIPSDERLLDKIIILPRDAMGAEDGMIVEAEITRWPSKSQGAAGRIIETLGAPDDADVEAGVILKKYGLPNKFPLHVAEEVKSVPVSVEEADVRGRADLRGKRIITIDGETAKDFDDAVFVERTPGGYRLFVSIADVSNYVKEGTAVDHEAYERGTSVYFPDRCIPMLPEALSNGICSLNPGVDRLTMTAEIDFNGNGEPVKKRFYESVIKSAERMTYTKVKNLLANEDAELNVRYAHIVEDLKLMEELAGKLTQRRFEAGSIDFDLPEPQIIIDLAGNVEDIVRSERNVAHRLIEEFMLAANKAVASEFSADKIPFLYRIHETPDEESINTFNEFIAGIGLHLKTQGVSMPKAFQRVLEEVKGTTAERLVNHVLLRSMKQAVYSAVNKGHFGLAFEDYAHFTSPIRRYPDLVVHRLLKLLISKTYSAKERERMEEALPAIAAHTSNRERKAMEAEREVVDLKKCQFMKDKAGETFDGFISGVTSFGLFVEMKDYFVEALVHVSALSDDYYVFDPKRHCLTGERTKKVFRLADPLRVTITRVDIERRRIDAVLEDGKPVDLKPERKKGRRR